MLHLHKHKKKQVAADGRDHVTGSEVGATSTWKEQVPVPRSPGLCACQSLFFKMCMGGWGGARFSWTSCAPPLCSAL